MESLATELSAYLLRRLKEITDSNRLIIGLCGIPASGKSSLAKLIVDRCNGELEVQDKVGNGSRAIVIGLDGWHLTRAQLDAMPDPKLAHDRRGAYWTFDGDGYTAFVKSLRNPVENSSCQVITAPAFDHARKDPDFDAIYVFPKHRLVLIEGLYTFLSIEPWKTAGELLDERWVIDIPFEEASKRLVKRHVITGVAKDMEEAIWRAEENDMPNGRFVFENMLEPTRRILSLDDPTFATVVEHKSG